MFLLSLTTRVASNSLWHGQLMTEAPLVLNGVAFVVAGGDAKIHATLYALDAATGKELWNSGSTITSFVPKTGGLTAAGSAVYLGTHDGTLWAFDGYNWGDGGIHQHGQDSLPPDPGGHP